MDYFKQIVLVFYAEPTQTMQGLQDALNCSKRKVSEMLRDLRIFGKNHGFEIQTLRLVGYQLVVTDERKYQAMLQDFTTSETLIYNDKAKRVNTIISILLASEGYISIDEISKAIDVSRSTVLRDLDTCKSILQENGLELESKKHYGLTIRGDERIKRRLFGKISSQTEDIRNLPENYYTFIQEIDRNQIANIVLEILRKRRVVISIDGFDLLMTHILILLYRLKNRNLITEFTLDSNIVTPHYLAVANEILVAVQAYRDFPFNELEVMMLAAQIMIYSSIQTIPDAFLTVVVPKLNTLLCELDKEFNTQMVEDTELITALINHLYPLSLRSAMQFRLENSFTSMIPVRYTYAVLIALRFTEKYGDKIYADLSKDEIGYLALHFATHFERQHQKAIRNITNILYVSSSDRANILLSKTQIEKVFVNGNLLIKSPLTLGNVKVEDVDLILYEKNTEKYLQQAFIDYGYPIEGLVTEKELNTITHTLWVRRYTPSSLRVEQLFLEECLFVEESSQDYLAILRKYAQRMIDMGYAAENYAQSVIERELRFPTVYENGVAAPHSMQQEARVNSIAVIYCDKPVLYQGKVVELIFMINIMKGYLFLHQDISDVTLFAIKNATRFKTILKNKDFIGFEKLLEERRKDGRDYS